MSICPISLLILADMNVNYEMNAERQVLTNDTVPHMHIICGSVAQDSAASNLKKFITLISSLRTYRLLK